MEPTPVTLGAYWRLVRGNPNFRRLWTAQIVSEIGDWFYTIAVYTLLLQLTGKAQSVGLAITLQVLPQATPAGLLPTDPLPLPAFATAPRT